MMRVGNEAGDSSKQGERLDFQVRGRGDDIGFVQSDVRIVLFVDVEVFDKTLPQKIVESEVACFQLLVRFRR